MIRRSLGVLFLSVLVAVAPMTAQTTGRTLSLHLQSMVEGEAVDLYGKDIYAFARADGSLVVGDPTGLRVLVVTPRGTTQSIGKTGEGPGEFRGIRSIGPADNGGFWVADSRLFRLQVFDSSGRLDRVIPYRQGLSVPPAASFLQWPIAMLGTSQILMNARYVAGEGGIFTHGHSIGDDALVTMDAGGHPQALAWRSEGSRCTRRTGEQEVLVPFCISSAIDASPDGRTAFVVTDLSGAGSVGEIGIAITPLSPSGEMRTSRIPTGERRQVTKEERVSMDEKAVLRYRLIPAMLNLHRSLIDEAKYHPGFDRLLVSDDAVAWIGSPKDENRLWMAVESTGEVRGRFTLPLAEWPIAAIGSTLWTALPDDDGFLDLRKYQIR